MTIDLTIDEINELLSSIDVTLNLMPPDIDLIPNREVLLALQTKLMRMRDGR